MADILTQEASIKGAITSRGSISGRMSASKIYYEGTSKPATKDTLGLVKIGNNLAITEDGLLSVDVATKAEEDNTKPITSAAVNTLVGNIDALLSTI